MPVEDIRSRVNRVLSIALRISTESIAPGKRLVEDLGVDGIHDLTNIGAQMQIEFAIAVPEETMRKFVVAQDIYDYVQKNKWWIALSKNDQLRANEAIAAELGIPVSEITPEKRLKADLGADEGDMIAIKGLLDERFDIRLDLDWQEEIVTVWDIYSYLLQHY